MKRSSILLQVAVAMLGSVQLARTQNAQAADKSLPESVKIGLVGYAELAPLAVTWSERVEAAPMGREKIPPQVLHNYISGSNTVQQVALRDGRLYLRQETIGELSGPPMEISFDGRVLYAGDGGKSGRNPKGKPFLHKWLPGNDLPEGIYFTHRYFRAAGIRIPSRNRELVPTWRPNSELLALLEEGARVNEIVPASLEGRALVRVRVLGPDRDLQVATSNGTELEKNLVVKPGMADAEVKRQIQEARQNLKRMAPQRQFIFYLDPERGHSVRRLEIRDESGHLLTRSDCTQYEQLPERKVWLPRHCRVEEYTFTGLLDEKSMLPTVFSAPLYVTQYQVSALDVKPWQLDRFEIKYTTPGTEINDATFPEVREKDGVFYKVPANPQQLEEVIAAARERYLSQVNAEKRAGTLKVVFLIVNGFLLAGLTGYLIARWRRKARRA